MRTLIFWFVLLSTFARAQVTLNGNAILQGNFTIGAAPLAASPMFGFDESSTASTNFPTVSYGMQRFWDSPSLQWPSINTGPGVFNFSNLDGALAQDYSGGVTEALYTLARTPPWISSGPNDSTTCSYPTGVVGGGNGECYPPTDLNADGSGTNATWKAWITAIAGHVDNSTYLQTHAHIRYWEIWNETASSNFWVGTFAQLARLTEDARCILLGSQGGQNVIHQSGNGTATPCTATAIDPTALIVMPSGLPGATAMVYAQNELYCNNTAGIPASELPCPNPANALANAVDVINFHLKPGNAVGYTIETAMAAYVSPIHGILQSAELAKPLWDGEASYANAGFAAPYNDPDMAASFFPRMYLTMWSLGFSGSAFYTWDSLEALSGAAQDETAYQQTYNWMVGSVLTSPCVATGTVYQCTISTAAGVPYGIIWDTSQSCSAGVCTTANQTVATQWTYYQDMTTASTPVAISGNSVPVGIKPVVLSW